jgi:hydrogenase maturation protease
MSSANEVLILGCGNLNRADDAAGLLVKGATPVYNPLDLIEAWSGHDNVIVVDAVVSGNPPGTIIEWDAIACPLTTANFRSSTHGFGIAEAVELARALEKLPAKLTILGIEGRHFETGGSPSAEVLEAVALIGSRSREATMARSSETTDPRPTR